MLSIESCEKILNAQKDKYTKEEIKIIRNILYQLADIEYKNSKYIVNEREGNNIYKSINRRSEG